MKLRDHIIRSYESPRPAKQCLEALIAGLLVPLALALIARLTDYLITGS